MKYPTGLHVELNRMIVEKHLGSYMEIDSRSSNGIFQESRDPQNFEKDYSDMIPNDVDIFYGEEER